MSSLSRIKFKPPRKQIGPLRPAWNGVGLAALIVPVIAMAAALERYITRRLLVGAVKG